MSVSHICAFTLTIHFLVLSIQCAPLSLLHHSFSYFIWVELAHVTDEAGHAATHIRRFLTANGMYEVCYEPHWEPYVMLHTLASPPFDERFVNQGGDKQAFLMHLNALKFQFLVIDDYLVHIHHDDPRFVRAKWIFSSVQVRSNQFVWLNFKVSRLRMGIVELWIGNELQSLVSLLPWVPRRYGTEIWQLDAVATRLPVPTHHHQAGLFWLRCSTTLTFFSGFKLVMLHHSTSLDNFFETSWRSSKIIQVRCLALKGGNYFAYMFRVQCAGAITLYIKIILNAIRCAFQLPPSALHDSYPETLMFGLYSFPLSNSPQSHWNAIYFLP